MTPGSIIVKPRVATTMEMVRRRPRRAPPGPPLAQRRPRRCHHRAPRHVAANRRHSAGFLLQNRRSPDFSRLSQTSKLPRDELMPSFWSRRGLSFLGRRRWVRIYCEKRCSKSSFSDATAVGRTPSAAAELAGEGKMLLRTAPLLLRLLRLLLLLLLLCAGVQAQLSRNTRMVQGGQCGEAALLCAPNVPNCDIDLLTNYALQMISGLELGTCEEVGYTVAVGSTTSGDCPGTRCVDVLLYAPTGAEICGSSRSRLSQTRAPHSSQSTTMPSAARRARRRPVRSWAPSAALSRERST